MTAKLAWENEYRTPKFLSLSNRPRRDFVKFIKKIRKLVPDFNQIKILDIGAGNGRHSIYLAELGAEVTAIDISVTAIALASEQSKINNTNIQFIVGDIANKLPLNSESIDICIDYLASNSLFLIERNNFINELHRILKPNGYLYLKFPGLDKNANNLIKSHPGRDKNSYIIPNTEIEETAFDLDTIIDNYGDRFDIVETTLDFNYTKVGNKLFKRRFIQCLLRKK